MVCTYKLCTWKEKASESGVQGQTKPDTKFQQPVLCKTLSQKIKVRRKELSNYEVGYLQLK